MRGNKITIRILTICTVVAAIGIMAATPMETHGRGIIRWQDENGVWHFTDSPVPPSEHTPSTVKPEPTQSPQVPTRQSEAAQPPAGRAGLFWRISASGRRPSYLLGTIHSDDPRVTRLKPAVARALDNCDRFVMEMEMDASAFLQFGTAIMLDSDQDLETILGSRLYARTVAAMTSRGMPETVVRRLKPWVAMAMLSMPQSGGGPILDMVLKQRAQARGIETSGLETAAEQLAVFDALLLQDQIELLSMTLDQLPQLPVFFEQLIKAYAADDLNRMMRISKKAMSGAPSQTVSRFMQRLNEDRNRKMAQRVLPYIQQGNSFIAVGSLHLAGPNGLLALLAQRGYTALPIRD